MTYIPNGSEKTQNYSGILNPELLKFNLFYFLNLYLMYIHIDSLSKVSRVKIAEVKCKKLWSIETDYILVYQKSINGFLIKSLGN